MTELEAKEKICFINIARIEGGYGIRNPEQPRNCFGSQCMAW